MSRFSIQKRAKSFKYAFKGLWSIVKTEHNFWIHLTAMVVVVSAGFWFSISKTEWLFIIVCIGSVMSLEVVNSAVERLADAISSEENPLLGKAKDMGAGAVLIAALMSVVVACIIFIPKVF